MYGESKKDGERGRKSDRQEKLREVSDLEVHMQQEYKIRLRYSQRCPVDGNGKPVQTYLLYMTIVPSSGNYYTRLIQSVVVWAAAAITHSMFFVCFLHLSLVCLYEHDGGGEKEQNGRRGLLLHVFFALFIFGCFFLYKKDKVQNFGPVQTLYSPRLVSKQPGKNNMDNQ